MRKFILRELDRLLAEVERVKSRFRKSFRHVRGVPAFAATDIEHCAAALQSLYETIDSCKEVYCKSAQRAREYVTNINTYPKVHFVVAEQERR